MVLTGIASVVAATYIGSMSLTDAAPARITRSIVENRVDEAEKQPRIAKTLDLAGRLFLAIAFVAFFIAITSSNTALAAWCVGTFVSGLLVMAVGVIITKLHQIEIQLRRRDVAE